MDVPTNAHIGLLPLRDSRVEQGFAYSDATQLMIANGAEKGLFLEMVDIEGADLQAKMDTDDPSVIAIPP